MRDKDARRVEGRILDRHPTECGVMTGLHYPTRDAQRDPRRARVDVAQLTDASVEPQKSLRSLSEDCECFPFGLRVWRFTPFYLADDDSIGASRWTARSARGPRFPREVGEQKYDGQSERVLLRITLELSNVDGSRKFSDEACAKSGIASPLRRSRCLAHR